MTICAVKRCAGKQKIGENMNRKIMILMVAVVATVLPAVAVADVMITGSVQGVGHQIPDQFYLQPGSNYAAAHNITGFTWTGSAVNESEDLGNLTLGYMSNETIYEINVLDINFTSAAYGNFYMNVSIPGSFSNNTFAADSYMYVSNAPFTFVTGGVTSTGNMSAVDLHAAGTQDLAFNNVNNSTTLYVAFVLGAGPANDMGSFNIAMSFVS
jgi:hypothetical protein